MLWSRIMQKERRSKLKKSGHRIVRLQQQKIMRDKWREFN